MADQQVSVPQKPFSVVHRYITTHNASGSPVFEANIKEEIEFERTPLGGDIFLVYSGDAFPAPLTQDADLKTYQTHLAKKHESFMIPGGFISRYIDYHPGAPSLWHRTISLDFGIVIEGEIQLELESGEKRILKKGDVAVQRGTYHAWSNPSETEFARVFYVAIDAKAPTVKGEELSESLGVISHK